MEDTSRPEEVVEDVHQEEEEHPLEEVAVEIHSPSAVAERQDNSSQVQDQGEVPTMEGDQTTLIQPKDQVAERVLKMFV